jgi:hypothetical protein
MENYDEIRYNLVDCEVRGSVILVYQHNGQEGHMGMGQLNAANLETGDSRLDAILGNVGEKDFKEKMDQHLKNIIEIR